MVCIYYMAVAVRFWRSFGSFLAVSVLFVTGTYVSTKAWDQFPAVHFSRQANHVSLRWAQRSVDKISALLRGRLFGRSAHYNKNACMMVSLVTSNCRHLNSSDALYVWWNFLCSILPSALLIIIPIILIIIIVIMLPSIPYYTAYYTPYYIPYNIIYKTLLLSTNAGLSNT
jgi:hypothetical protein